MGLYKLVTDINGNSVMILNAPELGEDGRVSSSQLPESQGVTLSQIKEDTDIADSLTKKHTNVLIGHNHSPSEITGTAVTSNDSRLNDARTPLSHTHSYEPVNSNIQEHISSTHAPSNAQKNSDITKAEIEAKLTGAISSHSHTGGSDLETIVLKVGDTANATTTYADATGLSFTALANKEYIVEGWIRYATSATTVGLKLSCNSTVTPSFVASVFNSALVTSGMSGGGGNAFNSGVATASAFATTDNLAMINILYKHGTSDGTFVIRFAAETTGTITIKDGSILRYRQVN